MCQQYGGKTKPTKASVKGGFRVFCRWSLRITCTLTSAVSLEDEGMEEWIHRRVPRRRRNGYTDEPVWEAPSDRNQVTSSRTFLGCSGEMGIYVTCLKLRLSVRKGHRTSTSVGLSLGSACPSFCCGSSSPCSVMRSVCRASRDTLLQPPGWDFTLNLSSSKLTLNLMYFHTHVLSGLSFTAWNLFPTNMFYCNLQRRIKKSLYTRATFIKINDI